MKTVNYTTVNTNHHAYDRCDSSNSRCLRRLLSNLIFFPSHSASTSKMFSPLLVIYEWYGHPPLQIYAYSHLFFSQRESAMILSSISSDIFPLYGDNNSLIVVSLMLPSHIFFDPVNFGHRYASPLGIIATKLVRHLPPKEQIVLWEIFFADKRVIK